MLADDPWLWRADEGHQLEVRPHCGALKADCRYAGVAYIECFQAIAEAQGPDSAAAAVLGNTVMQPVVGRLLSLS